MKPPKSSQLESIFFVCLLASLASLTTLKAVEIPVGLDVRRLFTVDINYDGLDDLVVGGTDGVAILIADGRGSFEPPDPLSGAGLVGVEDVNEDGFLDIITSTGVIFGSSSGKWSIGPTHPSVDYVGGEVADFDKDGHIDFIAQYSYDYYIFYGDGTGNFVRDIKFKPKGEFLVVQDIDRNNLPDVVQGSDDGEVYVYLNLGQRQWSAVASYKLPLSPGYVDRIYRPAVADFTGDGVTDIITGGYGLSKIYLLEGKGDGTYKDARSIAEFAHVGQLCVADFDKDGLPDVLASSYPIRGSTNLVMILYGDPAGQFARQTVVPLGSSHIDAATGDYNSDGWQDVAVLSWTTDTVSILINDGRGSFAVPTLLLGDYFLEMSADFDGDGYKDLILRRNESFFEMNLFLSYGNADGTFGEPRKLTHEHMSSVSSGFVIGYFDETIDRSQNVGPEARLDFGFTTWDGWLYILLNRGNRMWSSPIRATTRRDIGDWMATGDFNEDGFQDIIDNGTTWTKVRFLAGTGKGTFQINDLGLDGIQATVASDLDNDGHLDIVAAEDVWEVGNDRGAWIGWGKGNGSFDFVWDERIKAWPNGHRIWLADINGDGLCDIAEVNPDQVMLNLGNRSFSDPLPFGGEPLDINGDGDLDILKTYADEGCLIAYLGDGNFGWSSPELWVHGGQLSGVNAFYGPPDDPVANVLIGTYGMWTYPNPWRGVSVSDTYGARILDYAGPLNPGFTIAPTEFVLTLSEPVDPATVNSDSVYLASSGPDGLLGSPDDIRLSGVLSYDEDKWQITFIPNGPLAEGPYRFVVSGEGASVVCDLAGNTLDGTVYDAFPFISGNGRPGGSFISTFYVVDSLPEPQQFDTEDDYVSGKPTSPQLIVFDSNRRATITATGSGPGSDDYGDTYFLGELNAGNVVTIDLDGSGAGLTHRGGTLSILRHLPEGWVTFVSTCLTDGFIDPHLSFPVRYSGEYVLAVYLGNYERIGRSTRAGTYSIDIAIDSVSEPWGISRSPQTVFLDFDGSQDSPWGYIEPFDTWQLDLDSASTHELIVSIVDKVKKDFTQFSNIAITSNQPTGVDYSRVSVGLAWWIVDPAIDDWNVNHVDEGLVNSYSFWGMRHYGLDAVAQAMANTISHQIGHLLGLQHASSYRGLMNDDRGAPYWTQDHYFSKGRYWWSTDFSIYTLPEQDAVHILEYNTGPTLPTPVPPTIGSLIAEPNSVKRGETFRLYAQNVSDVDGQIAKVEFYRDKNANSLLEIGIDEYLGTGSYSSSSKRWTRSVATSSYSQGVHGFLARAMDNDGAWSNVVSTTVTVNEPPSPVAADGLSGARDP